MTEERHGGEPATARTTTASECRPLATRVAGVPRVRSAGPDAIAGLPDYIAKAWDSVDQAIDESFPASDPPGREVS